jgi:Domain of unknown function (DUF4177)
MPLDDSGVVAMEEMWEYKIVHFSSQRWTSTGLPEDINERFDEFGKQGWELVGTEGIVRPGWFWSAATAGIVGFFKRRLPG